jgi:glycosyltransferase involved in cell wall biosynthesis
MKILFLKYKNFSHINDRITEFFKEEYPHYDVDVIDLWEVLKYKTPFYHYIVNLFYLFKEYGIDILTGQKKWKEFFTWFFSTSYISLFMSNYLKKINAEKQYLFTFQTQSLFNGKIDGIPHFIYTDHTTKTNILYPDINPKRYMRSESFIEKSETKIYEDATMIFPFGNLTKHSLINQYHIPEEKVVTVFAASNAANEYVENEQKYFSRNILFIGVDWERKGGPILVEIFQKVLEKFSDASLTIVGCNPKNISVPNCNIVGKIPLNSISKYYNAANVFCFPTMRDPFPNVIIEAMSYRLPIVANNIGGITDMIQNEYNGFLINNNVNQYAEIICMLFANPERCKQIGENGFKFQKSHFSWDLVRKKMKEQIDRLIE